MKEKYPVVTLCGSTRFKEDFLEVQKQLTLHRNIVISVGLFGHAGDKEVWENQKEGDITETKLMLDDMHKSKIDMADSIFVINQNGYIGQSTWSEICYARMTGKPIKFMQLVPDQEIDEMVAEHIAAAEEEASRQLDGIQHQFGGRKIDYKDFATITYKRIHVLDPWLREDVQGEFKAWERHKDPDYGVNPFEYYGKKKAARFIEKIVMLKENNIYGK